MSFLYQAAGFFSVGKMKMIQRADVYYVTINITSYGFEFIGSIYNSQGMRKNSTGFRFDIIWSDIKDIIKKKERIMHVIIIQTVGNFYTILPLNTQNKKIFTNAKKNAIELLASINDAKDKAEKLAGQTATPGSSFCTNCGEKRKPDSEFCGKCGHKFS